MLNFGDLSGVPGTIASPGVLLYLLYVLYIDLW
jgi:hypothetical protein